MPGVLLALIGVHVALVWFQKHTQFPGPGRTEDNVIGVRILPAFAAKGGALLRRRRRHHRACSAACSRSTRSGTSGRTTRPTCPRASQPDFYMGWSDGMVRLLPAWEIVLRATT